MENLPSCIYGAENSIFLKVGVLNLPLSEGLYETSPNPLSENGSSDSIALLWKRLSVKSKVPWQWKQSPLSVKKIF